MKAEYFSYRFLFLCFFVFMFSFAVVAFADTTAVLRPTADGGEDSASWTNTAGTACNAANCSLEVKESSGTSCTNSDGDTSYVQSNVNSARQTFTVGLSTIPDNSTITQIDITGCAKKSTTGAANSFQTRRCVDGTCTSSGTNLTTGNAYAESTQSHTGLSITKAAATTIEIGAEVTGSVTNNVRLSQISAVITYTPPTPPPSPPPSPTSSAPGGGGGGVAPRRVYFSGQAYPGSKVELLRKSIADEIYRNVPEATSTMLADGAFSITLIGLLGSDYLFALRAEDKDGRKTGVMSFGQDLLTSDRLEVKDIFMPPTISVEKALIIKGSEIKVLGYAAPRNKIELEISDILKGATTSDETGFYTFSTSTARLNTGEYSVKARQQDASGRASDFSPTATFRISTLAFPKADFNNDNAVTITDWSIFLFRWGSKDEKLRTKLDMNGDGKIDIADFSIFLSAMKVK